MVLSTEHYETTHTFHIVGDGIRIPYDGIIGQDFFESTRARIDYEKREIEMSEVRVIFDDTILSGDQGREVNIVLKARCETVVKVPTNTKELKTGVIRKTELSPGVVMAETLTIVRE
jgi:hypothetical protein